MLVRPRLGPAAADVQVLLVTVDPENDTPEHLREYLSQFDARFIGVTGTREDTDRIAALFLAKYDRSHDVELSTKHNRTKAPVEQAYLYAHSQQIYLLDKAGRTRALFFSGSPLDKMQAAVQALLREGAVAQDRRTADCGPGGVGCPQSPTEETPREGAGTFRQPGLYVYLNHNLIDAVMKGAAAHVQVQGEWDNDLLEQVIKPRGIQK